MIQNYNNTEVLADLPEEKASQLIVKDFAARSKAKAKPQRKEPVDLPSIIPMNERKWIENEPGDSSLSAYEIPKKVIFFDTLKQYNEKTTEQFNSGRSRIFFKINFHKQLIGLTIVGKHACQQEEEEKRKDSSTVLILQEQLCISELFKDIQDVISLILHYRTM